MASQHLSSPAKILVVDDDDRNLLALSEVLSGIAEVVTASSGRDALRRLLKQEFAVILLDVFMPGMDGYETASLIREREHTAGIPIIFLSAVNKETEHLVKGYEMGAVDYVFKPVDPMMLKSKVSVFVDLFNTRRKVEQQAVEQQELREAHFRSELEKLEIERELQESRDRQAAIIQSLPMVLYTERADAAPRRPDFVSGDLEAITGYRFDEVQASPAIWHDRLHPEDRERVLAALAERQSSERFSVEYRWKCADGSYKYLHDQAVLLKGEGRAAEFAGTLIDITERKSLEGRLLQAGKMDALGQLTGGVAHDFNNLLAAVLGGIHVLERRIEFGPSELKVVNQMRHASEQGAELVKRMMAFARQQDLSPVSVDPGALCNSVAGLVSHTLGGTVTIDWQCPDRRLNLYVDRTQLELALMNLILNSRDAMPGGGVITVEIDAQDGASASADQQFLRIRVRDQGQGIPPEHLAKITDPFFTTKEAGKGTGLGLSMVAGFVRQSGGELKIDSSVGKGTTIDLLLPATTATSEEEAKADLPVPAELLAGRRMLLIDDDEAVRIVISEQLRDLGVEVDAYSSGNAALKAVKDSPLSYDFVLSDFAMPGLNGLETLERLKALLPGTQAVLMTGNADEELLKKVGAAIPMVRKPLDLRKVLRAFIIDDADPPARVRAAG